MWIFCCFVVADTMNITDRLCLVCIYVSVPVCVREFVRSPIQPVTQSIAHSNLNFLAKNAQSPLPKFLSYPPDKLFKYFFKICVLHSLHKCSNLFKEILKIFRKKNSVKECLIICPSKPNEP